tara:strand:+ start:8533 stop:9861 length:1329 start_codon:yes stop_codon:yes gene_type:complete
MEEIKIPTVSVFRFIGNSIRILKNPLPFHHQNFETLGDTFRLHLGFGSYVYFSRDAELAQYALQKNQKNYTKSKIQTKDLAKYVGYGLLTAEGAHWQRQRKMIQPAFHKKQLVTLLDKVQDAISTELDKITTETPIDIFPIFNDLAFKTVVKSLFSNAVSEEKIQRLQYITEAAQKMLVRELRQPYFHWWFRISGTLKKHIDLTIEARDILRHLIHTRQNSKERQDDLLDMLLDAKYEDGSSMTEQQLIDEILILFTAGHETTSNALTFTCELLARHPNDQEKIYAEVLKASNQTSTPMEFISACEYTKQVIEESMRLYPPAYFIDRLNLEEDFFKQMRIPKGSNLLFSIHEIHKHTAFWEDPTSFKPERFAENTLKYSAYYYPFGAGPRMCIGNNFAMYEMILTIADLVLRFKIEPKNTPIEILPLITLKPKNAILTFQKR